MNWRRFLDERELRGFAALEVGGWRALVREGLEGWAGEVVSGEVEVLGSVGGGRAEHAVVALPDGGAGVVRRYHRGGLIRHLNRDRYFVGHRAFEELRATERARAAGVRAPEVLMAAERSAGMGYRALFATRRIDGVVGADRWLGEAGEAELPALRDAGEQIRHMHEAGIAHPDLNLKNLLVSRGRDGAPSVHLIDFDRARMTERPIAADRRARDLRRLARSARKLGVSLEGARWEALRDGYGEGWPLSLRVP